MSRPSVSARAEAELAMLREAVERAGVALACLFSSAAEFEAAVLRARRAQGPYGCYERHRLRRGALILLLASAFLML